MPQYMGVGTAKYFATTGATCVTSANANLIGVLFQGSATASIQLWAGTTATGTGLLSGVIRAAVTVVTTVLPAQYFPFPAYASGGITVNVAGAGDPSITLFWSPAGGA